MTTDGPTHSWDGKIMTPMHDRLGRPGAEGPEPRPELPPAPCVTVMEQTAHQSARKVLQALLNVDIDDPGSVDAFQNRRRGDADLHRMMEKAIAPWFGRP